MFDFIMSEEQKGLQDEVRDLVSWVPRQLILDMDAMIAPFPRFFLEEAGRRKLLGLRFPEQYGGRGLKWEDEIIAISEMSLVGVPLTCLYSLVSIVGECIVQFGNEDQKERFLVPTLKGKKVCAEALTEPRGGSDFFGATCTARREGDHYVLHGQKRFIVGAEGADYFMVYARTDPDAPPRDGLSCFLVERDGSVEVKTVYGLMGARGSGTGRVLFRDTRVPAENLVGEENGASHIFYRMMVPERMTSAAGCVGAAREAIDLAARYNGSQKDTVFTPLFASARRTLDDFWLVQASAAFELLPGITLFGRVENLLDETYEEAFGYRGSGLGVFVGVKSRFGL